MEDELPSTTDHMKTSVDMAKSVYDSARKEAQAARQCQIINKMMTAKKITENDLEPATIGLFISELETK